ncbi:MAG: hypothetical protein HYX27_07075 [Acidobacteria bacterium]|nr:hypothetical protein [Acidobacteriota bacterium]
MKRTVRVARTAHDLDHVNRLRFPAFHVLDLHLKAGAKTSKSYLAPETPAPSAPDSGSDGFHFVPEKETIEIHYEIDDKFGIADGGKIEFFTRFDDTPLWTLDLTVLGADWVSHGKHIVKWDGRTVKPTTAQTGTSTGAGMTHDLTALTVDTTQHADFPDGYVTIQHGPYKVKLTVTTTAEPELATRVPYAWTHFHILIKSIELALGEKELVPAATVDDDQHKRDEAVRKQIETDGGLPADTATDPRKVILISNVFKTAATQMDDDTGFTEYKAMWGKGPSIPVVAKIRLAASDDSEVKLDESDKGAVALGKAKFLWDWEDPDEANTQTSFPKNFIDAAIDYDKATTGPKGDNCHVDRGGKRGPSADPVFPVQAGYAANATLTNGKFPFKVEAAATRKWASLSEGWTSGKLKGCTGAVFQPSRMAGDNYVIQVYLAYDKPAKDKLTLDADTQPLVAPDAIKKKTGTFQVWREVHIARYIRKKTSISDFSTQFGAAKTDYMNAYLNLKDITTADDKYLIAAHKNPVTATTAIDYNQVCKDAMTGTGSWIFTNHIVVDPDADHTTTEAAFLLRLYEKMVKRAHFALNSAAAGYGIGAISRAGNVVTVQIGSGHGYEVDDWVMTTGVTDGSYDARSKVTGVTADSITFANTGTDGSSTGGDVYYAHADRDFRELAAAASCTEKDLAWEVGTTTLPAPSTPAFTIDAKPPVFRIGGEITFTTTTGHGLSTGKSITISGVGDSSFDGTFTVKDVKSATVITVAKAGATAQSGGGELKYQENVTATITKVKRAMVDVATFTTSAAHGLAVSDQITISGVVQPGFNGSYAVKAKTTTTFDVDCTGAVLAEAAATGTIVKEIKRTIAPAKEAGASKISNTTKFWTTADHGFAADNMVVVTGVGESSMDGTYKVLTTPTTKSFTVNMGGVERISGGGTVQKSDDERMARFGRTQTWLKDWKLHTLVQYSKNMNFQMPGTDLVSRLSLMAGGKTAASKDGVVIMHFENVHSIVDEVNGASPAPADIGDMIYLLGEAIDVSDATRNRCAFVFYRSDVQTFVHEVGHHLFLPHAKYPTTGNTPGGFQVDRHDDDDDKCTMSYNHPTRSFCGLCQLRLRGWTALQLKKDDALNKKP